MQKLKAFKHWAITAKIVTSATLLVVLVVAGSLVGLYALKSMEKAVDTASQASEVLVSVNTATERVEHFIASRDQDSLLEAKAIMANMPDLLAASVSTHTDGAISLMTGLQQFSEAIDTLRRATDIMDTETSNMTINHAQLQKVATEIDLNIAERRKRLNEQIAAYDVRVANIQEAYRILQSIHHAERTGIGIVARRWSDDKTADLTEVGNAFKALLPVVDMLDGLIDATEWPASQKRLKTSVIQTGQAISELTDIPSFLWLTLGNEALQQLEITHETLFVLDSIVRTQEESIVRIMEDFRTDTGLLQNSAYVSRRFAEWGAKLEAKTLSFRLSPTDEAAGVVYDILDQLTRFARILPSAGPPQGSASVLTVNDQINGYRAAFDRFRQASKVLRQAHGKVRQEAIQTASLVTQFVNEQRSVAADNRERGILVTLFISAIAVLIALIIVRFTSHNIARPIVDLAAVMRRLADGHLEDEIVGLHRGDELGDMVRAVKVFQDNAKRVRVLEAEAEVERQRILDQLENMVAARTEDLQSKTVELEAQAVELEKARVQAEAATNTKSELLANMSHELRTPLNAILGYAQVLLRDKDLDERQQGSLSTILQSGKHLLTLINDLLDLSKIEAGKLEFYPVPVNLRASLQILTDIIRVKAEQKGLTLWLDLPPRLPQAVLVDEKRLRQVLLNLLGNAVKFTDSGEIRLKVRTKPEHNGEVRVEFAVEDSGIGMESEQLETIFQPFEQVGDVKRRFGGTGLGLAISNLLVRHMGGNIHVSSSPGVGSIFRFELNLPVLEVEVLVPKVQQDITGYKGPRKHILIVDDEPTNRLLLSALLEHSGFVTAQAVNGEEALERAEAWRPDLILMDVMMPVLDGFEATRQLRQHSDLQVIPVIMISASANDEELAKAQSVGANGFVSKPVQLEQLLELIGAELRLQWVVHEK